ncbi:MAG: hypothetical protein L0Y66_11880 [Myxococcaceae bacterium]|nr:hypothetical protein [Myxococcaceae bacterium]MCI0672621.1 hypothetical protein [Myxococcaceae bacterium]
MTKATQIVADFMTNMKQGKHAEARRLLADDLRFEGPFDRFERADDYLKALGKLAGIVDHVELKCLVGNEEHACAVYDLVTRTPIGNSAVAEWFQVKAGKIVGIRAHFDARPFAAMFGK